MVERVVELGGRTELLDFDDMLRPENHRMLHLPTAAMSGQGRR